MSSEVNVYNHLVKVVHLFSGIYLWEFVTTLDFEWEVFTGRRPWKWSFAVYLIARLLAFGSITLNFIGFNLSTQFNCNAWFRCTLAFSWFAVSIASFLLALRGIAIWGRDRAITAVAVIIWSANMIVASWSTTKGHTVWSSQANTCLITGTNIFRWSLLVNLIVDLSLLCIMFIGVLNKKNATHLWRMLYFQGIFWILSAIATEVPSVVLPFLNMNGVWNLMFQVPHMVLMVIMSTRLYRDLFQYITNDHDMFGRRRANVWHQNVQVAVHKTVEVDVDLRHMDEERAGLPGAYKQTVTVRSQAELDMMAAEIQMKKDLQI
ncbi:hypothetical protein BJV77DRAFT_979293 [Russula vinacea]|nr:hypothetical protein BJV77DRAFT_979293 [Russula vinacea]